MHIVPPGTFTMPACLALAIATASPAAAQPRYETVAQFHRMCVDEAAKKVNGRCEAYLAGAAETLSAFGNGGNASGICGRGVQSGELSRIFLAWAPKNRHAANLPRLAGATMALRQRFPCRPAT